MERAQLVGIALLAELALNGSGNFDDFAVVAVINQCDALVGKIVFVIVVKVFALPILVTDHFDQPLVVFGGFARGNGRGNNLKNVCLGINGGNFVESVVAIRPDNQRHFVFGRSVDGHHLRGGNRQTVVTLVIDGNQIDFFAVKPAAGVDVFNRNADTGNNLVAETFIFSGFRSNDGDIYVRRSRSRQQQTQD